MSDEPKVLVEFRTEWMVYRLVWDGADYRFQGRSVSGEGKWTQHTQSIEDLFTYLRQELNKR